MVHLTLFIVTFTTLLNDPFAQVPFDSISTVSMVTFTQCK